MNEYKTVSVKIDSGGAIDFQRADPEIRVVLRAPNGERISLTNLSTERLRKIVSALEGLCSAVEAGRAADMPKEPSGKGRFSLLEIE